MRRVIVALLFLMLNWPAAAQTGGLPLTLEQRRHCSTFIAYYEQRLDRLETELSILKRDFDAAAEFKPTGIGSWEEVRKEHTLLTIAIADRLNDVRLELLGTRRLLRTYKEYCPEPAEFVVVGRDKTSERNVQRGLRLNTDIERRLAKADRGIEDIKKRRAEFERRYGIVLSAPYRPFAGVPYTFFADVTKLQAGDRAFPDFNQTYVRDGNYNVNFGGTFDVPVSTGSSSLRFWLSLGWMLYYLNSSPTEVRNDNGSGVLRLTGTDDEVWGGAILAGFGGRLLPPGSGFGGLEWQLLGGVGLASSYLRGVGPLGNQVFSSRETVNALIARAALYYLATKNLKVGVVFGLIELERQTGTLSNLSNFAIGSATNTFVGASVAYTFD